MTRRLIYVVGPSGAGKDSVLAGLCEHWRGLPRAHLARRTVTRRIQAGGESHESLTRLRFEQLRDAGGLALCWEANALYYGIRHSELAPLRSGHCVLVNGSRAYTPAVRQRWPDATVVHITAPENLRHQRLRARQREDAQAIADRLVRRPDIVLPDDTILVVNDGTVQQAVDALLVALRRRLSPALRSRSGTASGRSVETSAWRMETRGDR